MKIFRKFTLRSLNNKVKALKPNINFDSCINIPLTPDQLSFDDSAPSEKDVGVVSPCPQPSDGRTNIPRTTATFDLERTFSRVGGTEPRVTSWFPSIVHQDDANSELSIMVLDEENMMEEYQESGAQDKRYMDEAEYRYHYTLRRDRHHDHDVSDNSSPSAEPNAQQYSRLRDSGLISTSFDEYQPTSSSTEGEAQRHPKMNVIFNWSDADGSIQREKAVELELANDKYSEEEERDSREVFMDAGLWAGRARSPANSRERDDHVRETVISKADTAFYIHQNQSMFHLPSIDSNSTNVFSQDHLSPRFVKPGEISGIESCESVTTEDDAQSISKLDHNNFAFTLTPTAAHISPGAPPNTPWDIKTPDLQLVSRSGLESSVRRRGGQNQKGVKGLSMGTKVEFEADYSFISFSSPPRVYLAPVTTPPGSLRATPAAAVTTKFDRIFRIGNAQPQKNPIPLGTAHADSPATPETQNIPFLQAEITSTPSPMSSKEVGTVVSCEKANYIVSDFAEGLNNALDVLECLAEHGAVGPTLAYMSAPTESIYSDAGEIHSKFTTSPGLGSPLSRFSEELAESDTDGAPWGLSIPRAGLHMGTPRHKGGCDLSASKLGKRRQRNQFGPKHLRKVLELYTLQYQSY